LPRLGVRLSPVAIGADRRQRLLEGSVERVARTADQPARNACMASEPSRLTTRPRTVLPPNAINPLTSETA
jgi:hypothetical protein